MQESILESFKARLAMRFLSVICLGLSWAFENKKRHGNLPPVGTKQIYVYEMGKQVYEI